MKIETKYVDVKGIRTRYLEAGAGDPLLLVHGNQFGSNCTANDWGLNIIDGFARSFHVFSIDKIGSGFTDNPKSDKEYVMGTTVQHCYDFLNTMQLDSAHLAGHSRGAYTVCRLALEYPEVTKTVVIVDSYTLVGGQSTSVYSEWGRLGALIDDERERFRYLAAANSLGSEHITDDYLDVLVEAATLPKFQEAAAKMKAGLSAQFEEDLAANRKETHEWIRAGKLKAPTLIVWGFNDPSALFEPYGLDALRLIFPFVPRAQMLILNQAGHYCFREQPEAFVGAVTNFMK